MSDTIINEGNAQSGAVIEFKANEPLTVKDMNSLLQKGHIVQTLGTTDGADPKQRVVSQQCAADAINKVNDNINKALSEAKEYGDRANSTLLNDYVSGRTVYYCEGTCNGNVIYATEANGKASIKVVKGTTLIVKMKNSYTSGNAVKLSFWGVNREIVLNGSDGERIKLCYGNLVAKDCVYSRYLFLAKAEYEVYFDGNYWVLKNRVVRQGGKTENISEDKDGDGYYEDVNIGYSGYRLWADGYLEQWGCVNYQKQAAINFLVPFTDTKYNFTLGSDNSVLTYADKSSSGIYIHSYYTRDLRDVYWSACGY